MAKATGLIYSLFDVALVLFGVMQYVRCILHGLISVIIWKCCVHYVSLTAIFNLLHSSMNKKSISVTKVATVSAAYFMYHAHQLLYEKWSMDKKCTVVVHNHITTVAKSLHLWYGI